jgi:hypothetical protein
VYIYICFQQFHLNNLPIYLTMIYNMYAICLGGHFILFIHSISKFGCKISYCLVTMISKYTYQRKNNVISIQHASWFTFENNMAGNFCLY